MDSSRNSYNGIPPSNGANGGHSRQQQMPGYSSYSQFQNPQLSNLQGMQQRGLTMRGIFHHQLEHRHGDHRDLIAALARQNNNNPGGSFPQHPHSQHQHHHHHQHHHPHQHQQQLNFHERQQRQQYQDPRSHHPQQHHPHAHQQHQRQQQQQQPQQQHQQSNLFFNGDQFHRHATAQQPRSQLRSPFAMLQEEHERRTQQELQEQQARKFHEFLFPKQSRGGIPEADRARSASFLSSSEPSTGIDGQHSSPFVSSTKTEELMLSPTVAKKRSSSTVSDHIERNENSQDSVKRLKVAGDEDSQVGMSGTDGLDDTSQDFDVHLKDPIDSNGKESMSDGDVEFVETIQETGVLGGKNENKSAVDDINEQKASNEISNDNFGKKDTDATEIPRERENKADAATQNAPGIIENSEVEVIAVQTEFDVVVADTPEEEQLQVKKDPRRSPNMSILLQAAEDTPKVPEPESEPESEYEGASGQEPEILLEKKSVPVLEQQESDPDQVELQLATEKEPEQETDAGVGVGVDATKILAELKGQNEASKDECDKADDFERNAAKLCASLKKVAAGDDLDDEVMFQEVKSPPLPPTPEPKDPVERMLSRLPELPSEPQCKPRVNRKTASETNEKEPDEVPLDVKEPVFIAKEVDELEEPLYYSSIDVWFPSNNAIKREKRKLKIDDSVAFEMKLTSEKKINIAHSVNNRLGKSPEPGVLDKLPHCKIHERMFQAQYGKLSKEPLFCCQVSEIYCNSVMICCSVCNTWRHAECGGHHTFYSPKKREANFKPICDRCYKEKPVLDKYPQAEKRMSRQRSIHLRKTHVAADIMRHAAYAKHGGTYKWPLGSVLQCNIGGHSRSVHIRHERSEKQWKEMLFKLNGGTQGKTKERVKQRTKELERVLNNLEEAEGKTDRHNMILFLERDAKTRYPSGFEKPQLNFFDPEEDHVRLACLKDQASHDNLHKLEMEDDSTSSDSESSSSSNDESDNGNEMVVAKPAAAEVLGRTKAIAVKPKKKAAKYCIRMGCQRKPRFDSAFCSDACGVSVMETDLLRSLSFANNMHPYNLRN